MFPSLNLFRLADATDCINIQKIEYCYLPVTCPLCASIMCYVSDKETCGWLIKGDPERPCARGPNHTDRHRDTKYLKAYYERHTEYKRDYLLKFHEANPNYRSEYRGANPEQRRQHRRKRRASKLQVPTVPYTRQEVLDNWGRVCWLCRYPLDCDWHIEHVIPLSKGGWDVLKNVRPAHSFCNLRKGDKMPPVIAQARVWFELGVHRAGLVCE